MEPTRGLKRALPRPALPRTGFFSAPPLEDRGAPPLGSAAGTAPSLSCHFTQRVLSTLRWRVNPPPHPYLRLLLVQQVGVLRLLAERLVPPPQRNRPPLRGGRLVALLLQICV